MKRKLFGTDGIRGRVNTEPMTVETAAAVGRAAAFHFRKPGESGGRRVLGRDTRRSGDMLEAAIIAGATAAAGTVLTAGILPTPGIAYIGRRFASAAIVISASHNPHTDNGIKLFNGKGIKLTDATESAIESAALGTEIRERCREIQLTGTALALSDAEDLYVNFLKQIAPKSVYRRMHVVVDCANGAAFRVAPRLFSELGFSLTVMFDKPDGININAGCGSEHPEALRERVKAVRADMGFAFDGDADRLIAVDETGNLFSGDRILALLARQMKQTGKLPKNRVVTTVMSNLGFRRAMQSLGIEVFTTGVGDRYVLSKMEETGAVIGGEDSGHLIFRGAHTTGDGLLTALKLAAATAAENKPLSALADVMETYPQKLVNVPVGKTPPLDSVPEIREAIQEAEESLGDEGRVLVRYSGTQPLCRVMVEAPTREETDRICGQIAAVVKAALPPESG